MASISSYISLCRPPLSLVAAFSAATGYALVPHRPLNGLPAPVLAVLLLACGASALNQWQERSLDAKMMRTRNRPLPAGRVSPAHALIFSCLLIFGGLAFCAIAGGSAAFALGCLALLWYNGTYTWLKKRTAFATVPGAGIGMVPPAIGWVAAGGALFDARLAALCFIFFLWQIPHFWLLLMDHGDDYARAGFPTLTSVVSRPQLGRIAFAWIAAAALASLALPLYGTVRSSAIWLSLLLPAAWIIWSARSLAAGNDELMPVPSLFRKMNLYLLLLMFLVSFESMVSRVP